ncbi:hypothetical protein [Geoglobus acetivorans]|uniref:Uncharacterized protein n=1 Tax=Geoglobus acetivorans TaxID=565033 RepID=A0ABZ3H1F0_GEOAI|nr:hypothetical protein [Geoglobus acetivorans]
MPAIKPVNKYTSNEFHEWQRENLPSHFVIQDIDTWVVCVSDSRQNYEPICIIELKRSSIKPEHWKPFPEDKPNYLALKKLCERAKIPMVIIYFKKGEPITDESILAIFQVKDVRESESTDDWIKFHKKLIKAGELKENFPNSLLDP